MHKIKILVIDKTEIFRKGLMKILEAHLGTNLVIMDANENDLIEIASINKPDIIIIHVEYPVHFLVNEIKYISKMLPEIKFVLITHSETRGDFYTAMEVGVKAYLPTTIKIESLIKTLTLLIDEQLVIAAPISGNMFTELNYLKEDEIKMAPDYIQLDTENYQYCAPLSRREKEVLSFVARGLPNDEIANILSISSGTVKVHVRNILEKLHARNRQQAAATAIERHLLSEMFIKFDQK